MSRRILPLRRILVLSSVFVLLAASAGAQDTTTKLKSSLDVLRLDDPLLKPWHWKIDVNITGDAKVLESGSIEAWYADGKMRTTLTLQDSSFTTYRVADKLYERTGVDSRRLTFLELLWMNILRPVPEMVFAPSIQWKQTSRSIGKTKLDCAEPQLEVPSPDTFAEEQPQYCLSQESGQYRAAFFLGDDSIIRAQVGAFQGRQASVLTVVTIPHRFQIEARTTKLEAYTPTPDEFVVPEDFAPVQFRQIDQPDQLIGLTIGKVAPHYPSAAKSSHLSGAVKFDAVIDENGVLQSLKPANPAGPLLSEAASTAIRRWTFRPYLVDGVPVPVHTVMTMNFNLQ